MPQYSELENLQRQMLAEADSYLTKQDLAKAEMYYHQVYEQAVQFDLNDIAVEASQGLTLVQIRAAWNAGNYQQANNLYKDLAAQRPANSRTRARLAKVAVELGKRAQQDGRLNNAGEYYFEALRLRPDYPEAQAGLADLAERCIQDAKPTQHSTASSGASQAPLHSRRLGLLATLLTIAAVLTVAFSLLLGCRHAWDGICRRLPAPLVALAASTIPPPPPTPTWMPTPGPTPKFTATSTYYTSTPTETPTITLTPVVVLLPPLPAANSTVVFNWQALSPIDEDFSRPSETWAEVDNPASFWRIEKGAYHLTIKQPNNMVWLGRGLKVGNFRLSFNAQNLSHQAEVHYGVLFRVSSDNSYRLDYMPESGLEFSKRINGQETILIPRIAVSIKEASTSLEVVAEGAVFELLVNGQAVAEIKDDDFVRGDIALYGVSGQQTPVEFAFDDFRLEPLASEAISLTLVPYRDEVEGWAIHVPEEWSKSNDALGTTFESSDRVTRIVVFAVENTLPEDTTLEVAQKALLQAQTLYPDFRVATGSMHQLARLPAFDQTLSGQVLGVEVTAHLTAVNYGGRGYALMVVTPRSAAISWQPVLDYVRDTFQVLPSPEEVKPSQATQRTSPVVSPRATATRKVPPPTPKPSISTPIPPPTPKPSILTPIPPPTTTPAPPTDTPIPTNTPIPDATNTPIPDATNTPIPDATNTPIPDLMSSDVLIHFRKITIVKKYYANFIVLELLPQHSLRLLQQHG